MTIAAAESALRRVRFQIGSTEATSNHGRKPASVDFTKRAIVKEHESRGAWHLRKESELGNDGGGVSFRNHSIASTDGEATTDCTA